MMTSHSSFVYISCIACVTVNGNLTVCNTLLRRGILKMASNVCREVDEVREEKLRQRRECNRLWKEWRKTSKACKPLLSPSDFGNGTLYRLARQRVNDRNNWKSVIQCEMGKSCNKETRFIVVVEEASSESKDSVFDGDEWMEVAGEAHSKP